jgi:hypothetical protein
MMTGNGDVTPTPSFIQTGFGRFFCGYIQAVLIDGL